MKKIILIIVIALIIILLSVLILKKVVDNTKVEKRPATYQNKELHKLINKKVDHGKYLKVKYSASGNMRGNTDDIELDLEKKEVTTYYAEGYNDEVIITKYKVSDKDLKEIKELLDKYNFVAWADLPMSDIVELDGPNRYLLIECSNDTYEIEMLKEFPKQGDTIIFDFIKSIKDLVKEENKID